MDALSVAMVPRASDTTMVLAAVVLTMMLPRCPAPLEHHDLGAVADLDGVIHAATLDPASAGRAGHGDEHRACRRRASYRPA